MNRRVLPHHFLAVAIVLIGAAPVRAQSNPATPANTSSPAAASSPVSTGKSNDAGDEETNRVLVEGEGIGQSILPMERPISSVYGTDLPITDVPRSVTNVSSEQLQQQNITSVADLTQTTPSSNQISRYGIIGAPTVRGDLAEVYTNGQRRLLNESFFAPSFTGVEAVDILKGPASVVDGPGSSNGGYVNFNTKQPYFDHFQGQAYFELGTYVPGNQSYFSPGWGIDFGGPVDKQVAYRFSYSGTGGQSYYYRNGIQNDRQDIYGSITYMPNDRFSVNWNGSFLYTNVGETDGINRPTQQLVDNRTYYTGVSVNPYETTPTQIPGSIFYTPNLEGPGGYQAVLYPTGTKKIYPYEIVASPSNRDNVKDYYGQMIATLKIDDGLDLVNLTYGEGINRYDETTYQYLEYVPRDFVIENRTELTWKLNEIFKLPIKNEMLTGFAFRFQDSLSYGEFQNEYYNNYDLTTNPKNTLSPFYHNPVAFSNLIPVGNGFYANPGTTQIGPNGSGANGAFLTDVNTNETHLFDSAVFLQDRTEFTKQWSTILGVRLDYLGGTASDPLANKAGNVQAPGTKSSDTSFVLNPNVTASLNYKPANWVTFYGTYDLTFGLDETADYETGGIPLDVKGTGAILSKTLKNKSELYEGGAKFSFLDNTLYAGADGFVQKRTSTDQYGNINDIVVRGVEVEAAFQPNKHLNITANFTWSEANYRDYAPLQATGYEGDTYVDGFPVEKGVTGTGVGSPNYIISIPTGRYRLNGFPDLLFNAFASYTLNCGFGVGFGVQAQSSQADNFEGTITIPAQYELDATLFYRRPRYEIQVNFNNITDQRNFIVNDGVLADNDLLLLNKPFNVSAVFRYKF